MTTVVLAHPGDRLARDVVHALRHASPEPVTATTPALLTQSLTYRHEAGVVTWTARLPSGELRSTQVIGVLNRAHVIRGSGFADAEDDLYAGVERSALLAAMLAALDVPVLNRPNGAGLSGPTSSALTLLARAARAGLPVAPTSIDASQGPAAPRAEGAWSLTVVGDRVLADGGPVPSGWAAPALAVAARTGCGLLRLAVADLDGMPHVVAVDPWPQSLGPQALAHLVALLAGGSGARPTPTAALAVVAP